MENPLVTTLARNALDACVFQIAKGNICKRGHRLDFLHRTQMHSLYSQLNAFRLPFYARSCPINQAFQIKALSFIRSLEIICKQKDAHYINLKAFYINILVWCNKFSNRPVLIVLAESKKKFILNNKN